MSKLLETDPPLNLTLKIGILIFLCFQNAGHALLTRYSRGIMRESYSSSEVVLMAEIIKLVVSGYLATTDRSETDAVGLGASKLLWLIVNARKVILLVILYAISNMSSYFALARVDASVYTVLLQLKTLTTPAFAVVLLNRNISNSKWRGLFLLVLGCILVASPTFNIPEDCDAKSGLRGENDQQLISYADSIIGISAILLMVTISGYSAIYFEGMLKKPGEKITIWERNYQLAFYSILLLIIVVFWESSAAEMENAKKMKYNVLTQYIPFKGWTINTVGITLIQAGGGLLVAATLQYADAVSKTLATSGSIVLSALLGYLLLGGTLDTFVAIGCICTILAIFNYTLDS